MSAFVPLFLSAFVPFVIVGLCAIVFLQVLETSPCKGGAAEILNLYCRVSSFAEQDLSEVTRRSPIIFVGVVGLPALR